ncbi:hypothetical protein BAE44_0019307, partial [Dichanthelium oligosanthes]
LGITEEELKLIEEYQLQIPAVPLTFAYRHCENMIEDAKELHSLLTRMRELHNWYKQQAKSGTTMFGVRVPREIYHTVPDTWVEFDCLFYLFQKRDLDIKMLSLWTMIISSLCSMEAQLCKVRNNIKIAFLDPVRINEETCKGISSNTCDIVLLECQHKESILLAYNYKYLFP